MQHLVGARTLPYNPELHQSSYEDFQKLLNAREWLSKMNNDDSGTEAIVWKESIPLREILDHYYEKEDPSTGTVVIHAGRVKLPGKRKPGMTHVVLESVEDDLVGGLRSITREAMKLFPVNRVQIHHRLGTALPGEYLLVVLISAAERGPAFDACRWVVDEIKKEKIIRLIEK